MDITFQKTEAFLDKLKHFIIEITVILLTLVECIDILSLAYKSILSYFLNLEYTLSRNFGSISHIPLNTAIWYIILTGAATLIVLFILVFFVYRNNKGK